MTTVEVTVSFRAKKDDDGEYKVPKLTSSHVSVSDRNVLGQTIMTGLNNPEITRHRFDKLADAKLPYYVNGESDGWNIRPIGKGFMADVSRTFTFTHGKA